MATINYTGEPAVAAQDQCLDASKASDTELARNSIENHQKEIAAEIARLSDKLFSVLRPELAADAEKDPPNPPPTTAMHGWLCEQRDLLCRHLDALRSLNQRLEV